MLKKRLKDSYQNEEEFYGSPEDLDNFDDSLEECDPRDLGFEKDPNDYTSYDIDEDRYDNGSCTYDSDNAYYN